MRKATRVLIAGTSARAAAESAARAGFEVTAIDAFGDLDQHPSVQARSVLRDCGARRFTAPDVARVAQAVPCDAVAYLSPFENHPRAVATLARGRELWGNGPATLRRVREPLNVMRALRHRGFAAPAVLAKGPDDARRPVLNPDVEPDSLPDVVSWLAKPFASGGGHRVRPWKPFDRVPRGCYLQERVEGTPGSVSFVAAGGRAVPLGVSRQLIGESVFGASGYRYCGTILAAGADDSLVEAACLLAQALAQEFGLVGVNGIDFIARDGILHAIEVNPRWSASMELVERAYGLSVFGAHVQACSAGALPTFDLAHARRHAPAVGKAIVFARRDVTLGDTRRWIEDPSVRDVPHPGERIPSGRPVCTVFATGRDAAACYEALVRRADRLYAELVSFESAERQLSGFSRTTREVRLKADIRTSSLRTVVSGFSRTIGGDR